MKAFLVGALFLLALCNAAKVDYTGDKVLRLFPMTDEHNSMLSEMQHQGHVDVWGSMRKNQPVDVRVPKNLLPHLTQKFNSSALPNIVTIDDVQR